MMLIIIIKGASKRKVVSDFSNRRYFVSFCPFYSFESLWSLNTHRINGDGNDDDDNDKDKKQKRRRRNVRPHRRRDRHLEVINVSSFTSCRARQPVDMDGECTSPKNSVQLSVRVEVTGASFIIAAQIQSHLSPPQNAYAVCVAITNDILSFILQIYLFLYVFGSSRKGQNIDSNLSHELCEIVIVNEMVVQRWDSFEPKRVITIFRIR